MDNLIFIPSKPCSLGMELELEILDSRSYQLTNKIQTILKANREHASPYIIKPELTKNNLEINTSIHDQPASLYEELMRIRNHLFAITENLSLILCGGGLHPTHDWHDSQIYPKKHYKKIQDSYGYLAKYETTFGMHVHLGCQSSQEAIYLAHALSIFIPQFIALSASSPFYQEVDTGFESNRLNILPGVYPISGHIPFFKNWEEYCNFISRMKQHNIISDIHDTYWDIRLQPELGTVELRVLDMPLTLERAVMIASYIQAVARYVLAELPYKLDNHIYDFYHYNKFQAMRFGFSGTFINPFTEKHSTIQNEIFQTVELLTKVSTDNLILNNIYQLAFTQLNDAKWLRNKFNQVKSFKKLIKESSKLWNTVYQPMVKDRNAFHYASHE